MTRSRRASGSKRTLRPALWLMSVVHCLSTALVGAGEPPPLLPESVIAALGDELSGTHARQIVQELTLQHRMRASRGIRSAGEAIVRRLGDYGLSEVELLELPADGVIFYGTQRSRPAWDVDFAELWELSQSGEDWVDQRRVGSWATRPLTLAQDSASGEVIADLVDVGLGTSAADYEGKDVQGQLVLVAAQPGTAAKLAVRKYGAAGVVSYAQNQKSAWWGEDRNLVRWGHMDTFPPPQTFGFMVTVNQALEWQQRLQKGERVRLRAKVEAGQHPGSYTIPVALIPGTDPRVADQEIVYSCHLDHPNPGANDNASGCAAILEVARTLAKLIGEDRIAPPRRSIRFVWPPEIEGTIALLNARPELADRAKAVIHMDMVGGDAERTKAVFHVTRSPGSLPTVVNDVAEAFGRFVNRQSDLYAATGSADYPLIDPEGSRQALAAQFVDFSMGSDHQVWTEGSFRVPAMYLNDWPDRYIHTDADTVDNIDATKLLRAAFLGAASGYYLANLDSVKVPKLLERVRQHGLQRAARAVERSHQLDGRDAALVLASSFAYERQVVDSIESLTPIGDEGQVQSALFLRTLENLIRTEIAILDQRPTATGSPVGVARVCVRKPEPKGPMWGFDYSYLEDHLARRELATPALLEYSGRWGGGWEYAYEILNLVDGSRDAADIRDAVSVIYGPVPTDLVTEYLGTLEAIEVLACE